MLFCFLSICDSQVYSIIIFATLCFNITLNSSVTWYTCPHLNTLCPFQNVITVYQRLTDWHILYVQRNGLWKNKDSCSQNTFKLWA